MCDAENYWFKYWRKKICLTLYSWTTVCVWNEGSLITELNFFGWTNSDWLFTVLQFVWNIKSYSKPWIYYHFGRNKSSNFCIYPFSIMFCHIGVWSSQEFFCGVHVIYTWPFFFFWRSGGTPVLRPPGRFRFPLVFVPQAVVCESGLCVRRFKCIFWLRFSMYVYDSNFHKCAFLLALKQDQNNIFWLSWLFACSENRLL